MKSDLLQKLKKLFKLRNTLVHPKTKIKPVRALEYEEDFVTEDHASNALRTVRLALEALRGVDGSADVQWIDSVESNPYV
jgi:uncharacterized protein YutE (UPF0331/DUF86 family)